MKLGYTAQPQYRICQHERDLGILTMGCGVIVKPSGDRDRYSTSACLNINDLSTIVIPFFQQHRLALLLLAERSAKWLYFQDFAQGPKEGFAPAIMGWLRLPKKGHLTEEGATFGGKIKDLAYGMNTFRKI